MKYKTTDGWDLNRISPLHDFIVGIDGMSRDIYELRNCKRTRTLIEMRDSLIIQVDLIQEALDRINDCDEVVEEEGE